MGLRARWTEERFESWFQARFDQWINERLRTEIDQRLQTWTDNADNRFQDSFDDRFAAGFDSRFNDRIKSWQDNELKKGFNAWVEHWLDNLFTIWANTWADGAGFQERFDKRFNERFDHAFQERLDNAVKARVANEIHDHIDRRIEAWLIAVRQDLLDAAPITVDISDDQPLRGEASSGDTAAKETATATALQLAQYLAKGPLTPRRIRKILKGMEIPGLRPHTYPLGEAAAALLLRRGRHTKAAEQDATATRQDDPDS